MDLYQTGHLNAKQKQIKEACEVSFYSFVQVVAPWLCLGHVHEDVCNWMQKCHMQDGVKRLLVLLPRGHLKSKLIALYAAWRIVKCPWITILYASASGSLAERQLYDICNILIGPDVRFYWKGLIHPEKSKRDLWRHNAINVDHPSRKAKGIRDHTIRAMSVGATIAGDHYDLALLDDIIAPNSDADPWTEAGRQMVSRWYAQLASVMNPGAQLAAVGTRYINNDIYNIMMESEKRVYDDIGTVIDRIKLFKLFQEVVEVHGQFLWPRRLGMDGEWYGFNEDVLEDIRETYRKAKQMEQFFAQYYQNPTDVENPKMKVNFQYYEIEQLVFFEGKWNIRDGNNTLNPINLFASMDLAFTTKPTSDYTAIIVEGVDAQNYRYVVAIDRFKTADPYIMMDHLFQLHGKWGFIKCRIETVAAQALIIPILQKQMIARNQRFIIEEFKPQTNKVDRIMASLSPLYNLQQVYHLRGGFCEELERQLIEQRPDHDDIADVHASVQEIMYPPSGVLKTVKVTKIYNKQFGGISDIKYN